MDFLINNWAYILVGFVILEKIVKLTSCTWDDILVDGIRSMLSKFTGKTDAIVDK